MSNRCWLVGEVSQSNNIQSICLKTYLKLQIASSIESDNHQGHHRWNLHRNSKKIKKMSLIGLIESPANQIASWTSKRTLSTVKLLLVILWVSVGSVIEPKLSFNGCMLKSVSRNDLWRTHKLLINDMSQLGRIVEQPFLDQKAWYFHLSKQQSVCHHL